MERDAWVSWGSIVAAGVCFDILVAGVCFGILVAGGGRRSGDLRET
jgi:hypothetical protein